MGKVQSGIDPEMRAYRGIMGTSDHHHAVYPTLLAIIRVKLTDF